MEGLALSAERPVVLTQAARAKLEEARKRLRLDDWRGEKQQDEKDEILERAYEDATNTTRLVSSLFCTYMIRCLLTSFTSRPDVPPLSVRLRKLWAERGDFSRFKASSLLTSEGEDFNEESQADDWNLGANFDGLADVFDSTESKEGEDDNVKSEAGETETKKQVMSIQDMLELRSKMMEKLATAQNALYFSHALVSLLINSAKSDYSSASNPSVAARAGSPHSNSAGGAAPGRDTTAASTSAVQRNTNALHVMGSAANLEAELGIEPNVFGASRLEAERKQVEPRGQIVEKGDDVDDRDEDEEDLEAEIKNQKKEDRKMNDVEREERGRDLVDCLQGKKQGLGRAVDILRNGASALRGSQERNQQEKMRWQILLEAKRSGWNLTPDKPVRGTANNRRELLEDGNRSRDAPARDAWIGYAIPEAHTSYKRRALAYVSHDIKASSDSIGKALAFVARPRKHLRVTFVLGTDFWSSEKAHLSNSEKDLGSVDEQLRKAQVELADAELFDAIVGECRSVENASLFVTRINSEDNISISLGSGVDLSLDMIKEEEEEGSVDNTDHCKPSAIASAALALLRLGLARHYRSRDDVKGIDDSETGKMATDEVHTPLLLPILGPLHFATFLSHLRSTLDQVKKDDPRKDYELHGVEKIQNCQHWLALLLQGAHEWSNTEAMDLLGGSATVYNKGAPVAFLTIFYPSKLSLSLPMKRNSVGNRGIYLSHVDLRALKDILQGDLQ